MLPQIYPLRNGVEASGWRTRVLVRRPEAFSTSFLPRFGALPSDEQKNRARVN
jgi:hypothetical protein